jgi:hypothetical protein
MARPGGCNDRVAMSTRLVTMAALLLLAGGGSAQAIEGRAYVAVDGQVGVARGEMARLAPAVTPGWDFRFAAGLRGIPLLVGLGGGALTYSSRSFAGPTGVFGRGDEVGFGPTTLERTTEMRHFDLLLRLEPEWRIVRPFVEGTIGTAQFFTAYRLSTDWQGLDLSATEHGKGIAFAWGWAVGLNVEPWQIYSGRQGTLGLVISAGLRGFDSRPVDYAIDDPQGRLLAARTPFEMLAPFVGVAIISRSPGAR